MHRPRHRRRDPQRTGPIRNTGGAWDKGEPWHDPTEPEDDDPISAGVREGYRVIEEQIRRGQRVAQGLEDDEPQRHGSRGRGDRERKTWPAYEEPWSSYGDDERPWGESGPFRFLGIPMRHLDRLVREIFRQLRSGRPDPLRLAGLLFQLQVEAITELARFGFGGFGMAPLWGDDFQEDLYRVQHDVDKGLHKIEEDEEGSEEWYEAGREPEEETWDWPPAPSVPAVIRASVPIPIYVWSHERTEIDLELPPGAQSLDLAVEPPLAVGAGEPPAPAFEAEFVALADGPVVLRVEVPRELPAGRYLRRVLVRATGEPVGDLTVQVGTLPPTPEPGPKPRPKPGSKPGPKPGPKPSRARKR